MKINKEIIQKLNPLFQAIVEGNDIQVTYGDGWMDINLDGEGINGEFYPCNPNIFAKTYEEVTK